MGGLTYGSFFRLELDVVQVYVVNVNKTIPMKYGSELKVIRLSIEGGPKVNRDVSFILAELF